MYKESFVKRFTLVMDEKGWDEAKAAAVFDTSQTMIIYYKQGRNFPRAEELFRMCDILDISADWISGRSDVREVQKPKP